MGNARPVPKAPGAGDQEPRRLHRRRRAAEVRHGQARALSVCRFCSRRLGARQVGADVARGVARMVRAPHVEDVSADDSAHAPGPLRDGRRLRAGQLLLGATLYC